MAGGGGFRAASGVASAFATGVGLGPAEGRGVASAFEPTSSTATSGGSMGSRGGVSRGGAAAVRPPIGSTGRRTTAKKQTMNTLSSMLGRTWRFMMLGSVGAGSEDLASSLMNRSRNSRT